MPAIGRESARTNGELLTGLLRRVGVATTDTNNREVAREGLREAVNEFNLERSWVDRRLTVRLTLVASTATYSLASRFRKSVTDQAWLVDSSNNRRLVVQENTYKQFLHNVTDESVTASDPTIFTIVNRVDTGTVELWPPPSATTITNYPSFEMVYFADIPFSVADNDNLEVSGALESAVFANALVKVNDMIGDDGKSAAFIRGADRMRSLALGYDSTLRLRND